MPEPQRHIPPDLYELLEVSPHAGQEVIQAAYRTLARNHHPDRIRTTDAGRRIRELNAAYEVLSDPSRRARYDLECTRARRHEWVGRAEPIPAPPAAPVRHTRVLPSARTSLRTRPAEQRLSMLNWQLAVFALVTLGVLAVVLFMLVLAGLDPIPDAASYGQPLVEFYGH